MGKIKSTLRDDLSTIMRVLSILDKNDGNISKTSRDEKLNRGTISRYKNKYWEQYISNKINIVNAQDVAQINHTIHKLEKANGVVDELSEAVIYGIKLAKERIKDKSMKDRDLNNFLGVAIPFILEKKTTDKEPGGGMDIKARKQLFIQQNFVNHSTTINNNTLNTGSNETKDNPTIGN